MSKLIKHRGKISVLLESGPLAVFFLVFILGGEATFGGRTYQPIIVAMAAFMPAVAAAVWLSW